MTPPRDARTNEPTVHPLPLRPSASGSIHARHRSHLRAHGLVALVAATTGFATGAVNAGLFGASGVDARVHSAAAQPADPTATAPAPPPAVPKPPRDLGAGNLLTNPGFEEGFAAAGAPELVVANDWSPWYDGAKRRPEFKDEPHVRVDGEGRPLGFSARVFHGATVQKFFTFSAVHDAGMVQVVPTVPGERLRFTVWVHSWSSDCDDPCESPLEPCRVDSSNTHGTYRASVGIEPEGRIPSVLGELPPPTVRWSREIVFEAYDGWFQLAVDVQAEGESVAVYTRGAPDWPVKHNDSYWDDARLERLAPANAWPFRVFVPRALNGAAARTAAASAAAAADHASVAADAGRLADSPAYRARLPGSRDPVPPDADVRIEYPVRAFPGQENFGLDTCDDLEFEAVLIKNHGAVEVNVAGWTLSDAQGQRYVFPVLTLAPGDHVRVWTKSGPDTTDGRFTDLYWGRAEPVWDGPAEHVPWDEAVLHDDAGTEVARRGYP